MKDWTKVLTLAFALGALVFVGACGDDDDGGETDTTVEDTSTVDDTSMEEDTSMGEDTTTETTYATVVFTIDDSANKTYDSTDGLAWKGSFSYDDATGELTLDGGWGGPFPALYDDGTHGDATADDGIWTIEAKIATPDADLTFEYGAIRGSVDGGDGDWIWNGDGNGTFTIAAGETGTVTATGMTVEPFGTIDLKLTIDMSGSGANLDPNFAGDYSTIQVKGSAWAWNLVDMVDDGTQTDATSGDGIFTFQFSENLGKHDGLLKSGQVAQFVFVLDGIEYKISDDDGTFPPTTGIMAYLDYGDGNGFVEATIQNQADGDRNTYVEPGEVVLPFDPPADHVAVNFCIDDTANMTYDATDGLAWKGSFSHDEDTRVTAFNGSWEGPFPMLYDDGPWDEGGHEPAGATAGDSIWCTTIWIDNTAEQAFEYGAIRGSVDGADGEWIWNGDGNGTFTVTAGATTAIDAAGMTVPAFGTTDLKLTLDLSNNAANLGTGWSDPPSAYSTATVKGSAWGWSEVTMVDDGTKGDETAADGIYTFTLGENLGKHTGKLNSGDTAEFVFVLDAIEYKIDGSAASDGVAAYLDDGAGNFSAATIEMNSDNGNTYVTAP